MSSRRAHWDEVYRDRDPDSVGWYQDTPFTSLALIERAAVPKIEAIVDIGCGASRLLEHLLAAGYEDVVALDVSPSALEHAKARLGSRAAEVTWRCADVLEASLPEVSVWHDRAVFHFFCEEPDRVRYVEKVRESLRVGGALILGTFALDGPERCSGLPVQRWDEASLAAFLGEDFELVESIHEPHVTPSGKRQSYFFARFVRRG